MKTLLELDLTSSPDNSPTNCKGCGSLFEDCKVLNDHLCDIQLSLRCSSCFLVFPNNCLFKMHRDVVDACSNANDLQTERAASPGPTKKTFEEQGGMKCKICLKTFTKWSSYAKHRKLSHFSRRFLCPKCPRTFHYLATLRKHDRMVHLKLRPYVCDQCGKTYSNIWQMKAHRKRRHETGPAPLLCDGCGKGFYKLANLSLHKKLHVDEKLPRSHHCDCGRSFTCEVALRIHREKVHEPTPGSKYLCCSWCKIIFKNIQDKKSHVCNSRKTFSCDKCDKTYMTPRGLAIHKRSKHENRLDYQCSYCAKRFIAKTTLELHEMNHTGVKPFPCTLCPFRFKNKPELRQHLFVHTGEKPFSCEICDMHFSRKGNVSIHMRTHTGEKPYVCNCGKAFSQSGDYYKHTRRHCDYSK